jgi:zinc transport system permease protein
VPVVFLYCLLLAMIALTVVMIIRVVGLILVIALLTIPPFIAEKFTASLRAMMGVSAVLSCLFTVVGLWLSYALNLTSGATIIMTAAAGFFAALLWERLRFRGSADRALSPRSSPQGGD